MRADFSLVNNVLVNAEVCLQVIKCWYDGFKHLLLFQLYLTWVEPLTLREVTTKRYGSVYPWPLGTILSFSKKQKVVSKLKALQWYYKTPEEVN